MKKIGNRILELRKKLDMNQKELADKAGITEASLSRYENNLREPKAEIIAKLAKALNTTTDYLLGVTDNEENTVAFHRTDGYGHDLPEEARKQLEDYIDYLYTKYGKKENK